MDILKQADLQNLIAVSGPMCISLYMPTHKVGREQQQDPIRLDNLITQAQEKLLKHGLRRPQVQDLVGPAAELLTGEQDFWQHQSEGLAIFLSDGYSKIFRLPLKFQELLVIAENFHLKPLLPLLAVDGKFYILAISMDDVRLFLATKDTVDQIKLEGVPTSMQEALWMDDPEKYKGFHTDASSPNRRGERKAVFYGHGAKPAEAKTNLLRYFQYVDAGLNDLLENKEIPMVLAGVEYLFPIYHEANTYSGLLQEGLKGNPDDLSADDLHAAAWKLVRPIFEKAQENELKRFEQFYGQQNNLASDDLKTVVKAAHFGQVETLFVPLGIQRWGRYDSQRNQVTLDKKNEPENEDLLDYAAIQTILNSGQVYALEPANMPGQLDLAAILRYAV
jgi:hypothetical protein